MIGGKLFIIDIKVLLTDFEMIMTRMGLNRVEILNDLTTTKLTIISIKLTADKTVMNNGQLFRKEI